MQKVTKVQFYDENGKVFKEVIGEVAGEYYHACRDIFILSTIDPVQEKSNETNT